ncbi:MAG: hypothetical protein UH239_08280 [Acutalibacteraceae bacterium]|nr:hypothetical protein [Acutalibacteraceae bacterium]
MILLIGLVMAVVFSLTGSKIIKKHSYILYGICTVISIAIAFIDTKIFPEFINTYIIGLFSRGAFATSLWIVVMWTGALKNGSTLIKKLMPIRGELSIMAAILTLGHNISFGKVYFVRLFSAPQSMSPIHLVAAIMSLAMLLIMIPLTIMSFPKIRKKMNGKLWKKIQRTAYVFYTLIYLHVITLYLPMAQQGNMNYLFNVVLYSIIFITYAVCRVRKWFIVKKKPENKIPLNVTSAITTAIFVAIVSVVAFPVNQTNDVLAVRTDSDADNKASSNNSNMEIQTDVSYTEVSTETTPTEKSSEREKSTEKKQSATEKTSEKSTNTADGNTDNNTSQNEEQVIIYEQANGDNQQADAQQQQTQQDNVQQNVQQENIQSQQQQNIAQNTQQTPQVQQPATEKNYIYNNGTYTATAFGYVLFRLRIKLW